MMVDRYDCSCGKLEGLIVFCTYMLFICTCCCVHCTLNFEHSVDKLCAGHVTLFLNTIKHKLRALVVDT